MGCPETRAERAAKRCFGFLQDFEDAGGFEVDATGDLLDELATVLGPCTVLLRSGGGIVGYRDACQPIVCKVTDVRSPIFAISGTVSVVTPINEVE
jgi:hypothetical protein